MPLVTYLILENLEKNIRTKYKYIINSRIESYIHFPLQDENLQEQDPNAIIIFDKAMHCLLINIYLSKGNI